MIGQIEGLLELVVIIAVSAAVVWFVTWLTDEAR